MGIGRAAGWTEQALRPPRRLARLLPNHCAVCRSPTRGTLGRLCEDCVARFAAERPRCRRCALPLPAGPSLCGGCLRSPPPWSAAITVGDYGYPWAGLLAAQKFDAALDLAPALAALLAARVDASAVDALVPVPLAARRLRERGYNQAARLAAALARRIERPLRDDWLLRLTDTAPQLGLPRGQRLANLRGAFAAEPLALHALRGRRIALVDDVMTTGATLAESARTLLAAGAAEVQAWVVARTPD